MKILICEDDLYSGLFLKEMLLKVNPKLDILINENLLDAVKSIKQFNPDLMFLDIELGANNSFELFDIYDFNQLKVVFVSSHIDYAYKAFKIDAIDYVLKPITFSSIEIAYNKAINKTRLTDNSIEVENNKLMIWENGKYNIVKSEDILKIKSSNQYSNIYFIDGKKVIQSTSLSDFEKKLNSNLFIRIHDSCIVNLNYVKNYFPGINSSLQLINDDYEKISRRRKELFLKIFNK